MTPTGQRGGRRRGSWAEGGRQLRTGGERREWGAEAGGRPGREKAAIVKAGQLQRGPGEGPRKKRSPFFSVCARGREEKGEAMGAGAGVGGEKQARRRGSGTDGDGQGLLALAGARRLSRTPRDGSRAPSPGRPPLDAGTWGGQTRRPASLGLVLYRRDSQPDRWRSNQSAAERARETDKSGPGQGTGKETKDVL